MATTANRTHPRRPGRPSRTSSTSRKGLGRAGCSRSITSGSAMMYLFGILGALLARRRRSRCSCAPSCCRPGKTIVGAGHLQPDLHAARRGDGVPRHHPGIPAALGNIILPIQLGAKDVAFPRLNLASFYLWVLGRAAARRSTIPFGGLDTGWTFYTPYTLETQDRRS